MLARRFVGCGRPQPACGISLPLPCFTPGEPVDARPTDPQTLGDRRGPETLIQETPDLVCVYRPRPPLVDTPRLGGLDALHLALAAEVRLELAEDTQHREKRLAGGGARVDGLLRRLEMHALLLQL